MQMLPRWLSLLLIMVGNLYFLPATVLTSHPWSQGASHGYFPSSEGCRKRSEEGSFSLEPRPCLGIDGDHSVAIV
eukprot:11134802-Heterocapsa_arctica.AAC.1